MSILQSNPLDNLLYDHLITVRQLEPSVVPAPIPIPTNVVSATNKRAILVEIGIETWLITNHKPKSYTA
ncbi:MAG TPA: hypothetical protein VFI70_08550 [Nitrososphaeraceae archaeon]|nr:hypothetical protein [Nitrososphaeraceae archaeon]